MANKVSEAVTEVLYVQRLQSRIAELKQMRDKLVADANQQIAAMNAAISELEAILNPPEEKEADE